MTQKIPGLSTQMGKKINPEEIEEIVKAISGGKYSWACVLVLRFAGYNPIDYIPYRTYIRLIKNNCLADRNTTNQKEHDNLVDIKSKYIRI